jgi:hypothetical protein
LTAQIEASIWREDELRVEMTSGGRLSPAPERRPTETRPEGGAWLRPFRRWDGYREAVAAALRQLHGGGQEADEREEELARR